MSVILGKKFLMEHRHLWERHGTKKACRLCGQFIDNGEEFYLVVVPFPYSQHEDNFLVHAHEWEHFCEGVENIDALMNKLRSTKKPRTKNATKVDERVVSAFKKVLRDKGYRITKETSNRIYFKASRKMANFYFDKRFQTIDYQGRANGLWDGLFLREFYARLHEALQKELGQETTEGFRVEKVVQQALETVDELMK
jgi:hypothetical protein